MIGGTNMRALHRPSHPVYVSQLCPDDVLLGRGTGPNEHVGNRTFRDEIVRRQDEYHAATYKAAKDAIGFQVIDAILARGGRFLKKELRRNVRGKSIIYEVVSDRKTLLDKIKQAFRYGRDKPRTEGASTPSEVAEKPTTPNPKDLVPEEGKLTTEEIPKKETSKSSPSEINSKAKTSDETIEGDGLPPQPAVGPSISIPANNWRNDTSSAISGRMQDLIGLQQQEQASGIAAHLRSTSASPRNPVTSTALPQHLPIDLLSGTPSLSTSLLASMLQRNASGLIHSTAAMQSALHDPLTFQSLLLERLSQGRRGSGGMSTPLLQYQGLQALSNTPVQLDAARAMLNAASERANSNLDGSNSGHTSTPVSAGGSITGGITSGQDDLVRQILLSQGIRLPAAHSSNTIQSIDPQQNHALQQQNLESCLINAARGVATPLLGVSTQHVDPLSARQQQQVAEILRARQLDAIASGSSRTAGISEIAPSQPQPGQEASRLLELINRLRGSSSNSSASAANSLIVASLPSQDEPEQKEGEAKQPSPKRARLS